jgi:hypothetical protein
MAERADALWRLATQGTSREAAADVPDSTVTEGWRPTSSASCP